MYQIDLTTLSDEQITAFTLIDPAAAAAERKRRSAYDNVSDLFTDLAQVGLDLEVVFENHTKSVGVKAIRDSRVLMVIRRALAYAENRDIAFTEPKLVVHAEG